jgi:hypothetical protein
MSDVDGQISAGLLMSSIASPSSLDRKVATDQEPISQSTLQMFINSCLEFLAPLEDSLEADVDDRKIIGLSIVCLCAG